MRCKIYTFLYTKNGHKVVPDFHSVELFNKNKNYSGTQNVTQKTGTAQEMKKRVAQIDTPPPCIFNHNNQ